MREPRARSRLRTAILVFVLLGAAAFALVRAVISSFQQTCEVCVTYQGRTVCREAVGSEPEEATRIARASACEFLTADPDAMRACVEREPDSAVCQGK